MFSALTMPFQYASRQLSAKDVFKLALGSIVFSTPTKRWKEFIERRPLLTELASQHPRLLHKIYRPYLSSGLNCNERVECLINHYSQVSQLGFDELIAKIANRPISLCEFTGKSGIVYQLKLASVNESHREGELCFLLQSNGVVLYRLAFLFLKNAESLRIKVGCLQGVKNAHGKILIKQATKELYGCRPKKLMVSVVMAISKYLHATSVVFVSNEKRVAINFRRRSQISSDYDKTWQELGAIKRDDGDFELLCTDTPTISIDSIPSKKRSEVKKRMAMLEMISTSVGDRLDCFRRPSEKTKSTNR